MTFTGRHGKLHIYMSVRCKLGAYANKLQECLVSAIKLPKLLLPELRLFLLCSIVSYLLYFLALYVPLCGVSGKFNEGFVCRYNLEDPTDEYHTVAANLSSRWLKEILAVQPADPEGFAFKPNPLSKIKVIISVISVDRRKFGKKRSENYLSQTLHGLYNAIYEAKYENKVTGKTGEFAAPNGSKSIDITVSTVLCLPDITANSSKHFATIYASLMPIVKRDSSYKSVDLKSASNSSLFNASIQKEASDYEFCLSKTATRAEPGDYILMLEDDAVAGNNFIAQLDNVISQIHNKPNVAFVKLFHPEHLRKIPFLFQAASIAFIVALMSYLVCCKLVSNYAIFNITSRKFVANFYPGYRAVVTAIRYCFNSMTGVTVLTTLLVLYYISNDIGPDPIAGIRYQLTGQVYMTNIESCCTPAVLFPQHNVHSVINALRNSPAYKGHAKDHILDSIATTWLDFSNSLTALMTDRDLVTHIGRYSSLLRKHN